MSDPRPPVQPGYSPNGGLRVNPDGTVSYQFDGVVLARGLDLIAAGAGTPPADRKVRWLRTPGGVRIAELVASDVAGDGTLRISAFGDAASFPSAEVTLQANTGGTVSALSLRDDEAAGAGVTIELQGAQTKLLHTDGSSGFVLATGALRIEAVPNAGLLDFYVNGVYAGSTS